jgi:hypothetical protein
MISNNRHVENTINDNTLVWKKRIVNDFYKIHNNVKSIKIKNKSYKCLYDSKIKINIDHDFNHYTCRKYNHYNH